MLRTNPTRIDLRDVDLKEYESARLAWKANEQHARGGGGTENVNDERIDSNNDISNRGQSQGAKNARHARMGLEKTSK